MQAIHDLLDRLSGIIWGEFLLIPLLAVTGVYLTLGLRLMPWLRIGEGFRLLFRGRRPSDGAPGDITPFQSLMTALSATIGTGNIAGVATAIHLGGPGALFWMWVIALFGMATKYAEAVLAVKYREVDELGQHVGGPMYYIRNGLGPGWAWLGGTFALFGMIAAFGIGNTVQSNSVADAMQSNFDVPLWLTGVVMAVLAGLVILGGIKRIAEVAGKLVPFMAIAYVVGALVILVAHAGALPAAFATIFDSAFNGTAATGGFAGATVWAALRFGFARGIFSNESGLGSAPIAHAAARTNDPVRQGKIAMLGTFIDTIIVCSMTGLVIVVTGEWTSGATGAALSSSAFSNGIAGGQYIVTFGLVIFAFTTLLGWSYYGERCAEYLFGTKVILPYRILWIAAIFGGSIVKLGLVWVFADVLNGLMALPNLVALLLLSPVVFAITREAGRRRDRDA
ncbi:MAG: sodium:alanine symporter family protein [Chromatiales bacterium]|nr:sodium:alanine symporter family protein [Chromatiales bacterium]